MDFKNMDFKNMDFKNIDFKIKAVYDSPNTVSCQLAANEYLLHMKRA